MCVVLTVTFMNPLFSKQFCCVGQNQRENKNKNVSVESEFNQINDRMKSVTSYKLLISLCSKRNLD